jgi:hypothetical protein
MTTRLTALLLVLLLAALGGATALACGGDDDDDDNDTGGDDTSDDDTTDDDTAADDTADDDSGDDDSGTGCSPVTDPFPPSEEIYRFIDVFSPMATYVGAFQGQLMAMGQTIGAGNKADSFQVQFPDTMGVGEHDLAWDEDPTTNDVMGLFIFGLTVSGTYDKAFYAYRGCMDVTATGGIGDLFSAHFTSVYMTEAVVDFDTGQVQVMAPGEGMQAFIMDTTIECTIVEFSQTPSIGDLCMNVVN